MRRYASLRWRLTSLIAAGSVVAAIIAAAGFSWFDLNRFWQRSRAEVETVGNVVADQVAPAISLGDRKAAGEILASLRSDGLIQDAVLYDIAGSCFAAYRRTGFSGCPAEEDAASDLDPGDAGIVVSLAVTAGSDRCGSLLLSATRPSVASLLQQYSGGAILIVALSLVVAGMMAIVLQSRVSSPILTIAQVAQRIAQTHQFNDRVTVASADELGVLADSFNAMLCEIQRRDAELGQQRSKLEEQIVERSRVNAELRAAKEKAEDADRLKSEFLANMSHEIRTPMNGVTGMISLVLDRCDDSETREQLLVAQNAAQSLLTILNDILDLSKIEAGKMTIEAIDFDLTATLRESMRIFETTVQQKGLDLRLIVSPGVPAWVRGDPARLRQVLVNLIGNAVKFTDQGRVQVLIEPGGAEVLRFAVEDTGIGIPPAKLGDIFEAFTQADGSHTRRFGGTGLGLTITRRLVDLMGGRLWAESAIGAGSRFSFELPLAAVTPPSPAVPEATAAEPPLPLLNVLVAEDNLVNQKVIDAILRRQGWTVTLASNGEEALAHFGEQDFDLILMDVQMPGMDGLEATRRIRDGEQSRGDSQRIPILALTAHASVPQHRQCLTQGMDGVLTKPITLPALLREIRAVIRPLAGALARSRD